MGGFNPFRYAHRDKKALLTLRAALVLFCALIVGSLTGGLTYLGTKESGKAVLAGGAAFAGAVIWFDKIIAA